MEGVGGYQNGAWDERVRREQEQQRHLRINTDKRRHCFFFTISVMLSVNEIRGWKGIAIRQVSLVPREAPPS